MKYAKLIEPTQIGLMKLRNRIVMPGMGTNLGDEEGYVSERNIAYFEERARGGAGLVILGTTSVDFATGRHQQRGFCIDDDRFIPGMSQLAEAIKKHGAKSAVQLHHAGRTAREQFVPVPLAPSAIAFPGRPTPKAMTIEEIAQIVSRFGQAAKRVKEAGFDGAEIHAGHKYLIANFLSCETNKRQDEYGGNLKNRARILVEIISAVRKAVGQNFPIWCRINGREIGYDQGFTIDESKQVAKMIEQAGVDAVSVSAQGAYPGHAAYGPITHFPGSMVPWAEEIKKVVTIPVIAAGRINSRLGEQVISKGQADLIAMGRPLIADPELPNKLATGRPDEIRPCIYCSMCSDHIWRLQSLRCTVNAAAGIETEYQIRPAERTKRVMVIGGGPGGMEAARIASKRGHQVTLYEKGSKLGGGLNIISILNNEVEKLLGYLRRQTGESKVEIRLGQEVSADTIKAFKPDVIISAVGATLVPPAIPGIDGARVITGTDIRRMMSGHVNLDKFRSRWKIQEIILFLGSFLLRRNAVSPSIIRRLTKVWMPMGKRIIIIGGDRVGCETAEFLAERTKKITMVDSDEGTIGKGIAYYIKDYLIDKLGKMGVVILSGVKYEEVTGKGLVITNKGGKKEVIEADTIVLATDAKPNSEFLAAIQGLAPEIYDIGDCRESQGILEAIAEGSHVARSI